MKKSGFKKFIFENGLSVVLIVITFLTLIEHSLTGFYEFNEELKQEQQPAISYSNYLSSGRFVESVFENWESEFLQMGLYVLLTSFLMQKGSSESKDLTKKETENETAIKGKDTPYPVRKGGLALKLYQNSLFIALMLLFLFSFILHAKGGAAEMTRDNAVHNDPKIVSTFDYMHTSKFWYESFQNWQSEFLSMFAIVVLSIWLRQKGSPESKKVNAAHSETGG